MQRQQAAVIEPKARRRGLLWISAAAAVVVVGGLLVTLLPDTVGTTSTVIASDTDLGDLQVFKPDAPPKELVSCSRIWTAGPMR